MPLIQLAMRNFTVVAPDLAGYGNSWPLPISTPTIADYAVDICAFLDAVGIARILLYGEREGAAVALEIARHAPSRVAAFAASELEIWTPQDGDDGTDALKPFVPAWDGSHLTWLWAYLREENVFQPWWRKRLSARVADDMPTPPELHARVVQFLSGGSHGRGYELGLYANLLFDPRPAVAALNVPALFVCARNFGRDQGLKLLEPLSSTSHTCVEGSPTACFRSALSFLASHCAALITPPAPPRVKPIADTLWSDFVAVPGGQLHFQCNSDANTIPILVQHDAASSVGTVGPISRSIIGRRTVMAFDLPGSGESDDTLGDGILEVGAYADVLAAGLKNLDLRRIDFYGMWGGGFVGLELAIRQPTLIRRLVMSNVFQHDGDLQHRLLAEYTPEIVPIWHGGHLMQCWHQMRDQGLYFPWFDAKSRSIVQREPFLATDMIHERTCSLLKAGNMYRTAYQSHFRYRTYDRLHHTSVPTVLAIRAGDPNNPRIEAAAQSAPHIILRHLRPEFHQWGESFLDLLESADRGPT